ncbi:metal-dependent hydrolase [Halorussus halobius]|uniref:metal-dependent hydrolase n=1 Tax=Halorussus halobius TaxID=1710537 RepID=UPI001092E0B1|nr:metal-dependent hydrolase [Halorussus halobius]
MPSTVVHVALAGLVGTALLADRFDAKAVLAVMAATAFVDLDVLVGFWIPGAHRAAFHTLVLPALVGAMLWWDLRGRAHPRVQSLVGGASRFGPLVGERSRIRSRWGARGVRTAWVSVVAVTLAGIGPDAFFNGANLFYPLHDRFYTLSGEVLYSTHDGFVQTIVNVNFEALVDAVVPDGGAGGGGGTGAGAGGGQSGEPASTTENTHYRTGVDPARGDEPENVERVFPIAMTGERALLALTGYAVVGYRVWEERRSE